MDIANYGNRVNERFAKDLIDVRTDFQQDFLEANASLIVDIEYLKKQRARDKSDFVRFKMVKVIYRKYKLVKYQRR